ncbi:hypothetical protein Pse7367_3582 [Thalassoporum mexicanum PCC 7367]|nr:hypothetical protein Pse7367_3582 [Pseudanabaena sp. PCC 7367]
MMFINTNRCKFGMMIGSEANLGAIASDRPTSLHSPSSPLQLEAKHHVTLQHIPGVCMRPAQVVRKC